MLRDAAAFEVSVANQSSREGPCEEEDEEGNPLKKAKTLTNEEKSQLSREKNREHARNTRRRKKIFVSKLKEMVETLTRQKDSQKKERFALGKRIAETQQQRHHLVKLFLNYRANNVQDRRYWELLCDESFTLTLPITPYRYYNKAEVNASQRVVEGIDALLIDTASVALMVESIGLGNSSWIECLKRGQGCKMSYLVNERTMISCGDVVSCGFCLLCEGHHMTGVHDINMRGMLQCKFNDSNLLVSMELTFDVMGFMQQFQRAVMLDPQRIVIPNTVHLARQESRDARLIVSLTPPHAITSVNSAYWRLCGKPPLSDEELASSSLLSFLSDHTPPHNGFIPPARWTNSLTALLDRVAKGFPLRYHYPKLLHGDSEFSLVYLQFFPLSDEEDTLSSLLVTVMEIPVSLSSFMILDPFPAQQTLPPHYRPQPEAIPSPLHPGASTPTLTWTAPVTSPTATAMFQSLETPSPHLSPSAAPLSALHLPPHSSPLVTTISGASPPMVATKADPASEEERR